MARRTGRDIFSKRVARYLKSLMDSGGHARGVLKKKVYKMPGVKFTPLEYTKRSLAARWKLRREFNNGGRQSFLKSLTEKDLLDAGIPKNQWDKVRNGKVPKGYQVHHIHPLDDSGTNAMDNLVLIKNSPDHQLLTNHQRWTTQGLRTGDTDTIPWPTFPPNTKIWPPPGGGAFVIA